MLPSDFNLPVHFSSFREDQLATAFSIALSSTKFHIIKASTGKGKSLINVLIHQIMAGTNPRHRSIYTSHQKGLMDQLQTDFHSLSMFLIKGANNYRCPAFGNCESGGARECSYRARQNGSQGTQPQCAYLKAKSTACSLPLINSNFSYNLALASNGDSLGQFDLSIIDEAHELLDTLTQFATINLDQSSVRGYLQTDLPTKLGSIFDWQQWAGPLLPAFREYYSAMRKVSRPTDIIAMERFGKSLRALVDIPVDAEQWLLMPKPVSEPAISFIPVWPKRQAKSLLLDAPKKVVLSSATFNRQDASYIGITEADGLSVQDLDSTFPIERRPFYFITGKHSAQIDYRLLDSELLLLMRYIDKHYLEPRLGHRIVIHSRSYDWARRIIKASSLREHMITHRSGDTGGTRAFVERFFAATPPVIAVSPDMTTGYSLDHAKCRYMLVLKAPTLDSRDLLTKARISSDKTYRPNLEAADLQQTYGRGMRAPDDWCEVTSFDSNMTQWFLKSIKPYCPKSFTDAWKIAKEVPQPLHTILGG